MPTFGISLRCIALVASSVRADEGARTPDATERQLRHQQWVEYRLRQRAELRIGWPIAGVIVGAGLIGAGVPLLVRAIDDEDGLGRGVGGVVMSALGIPIAIASTFVLWGRARKRRAITRDIAESVALGGFGFRF